MIAERGIAAATTKEIARAAGVSEGSLYNHFAKLTGYLAAEQKAGRVAAQARPVYLASVLMGACHQYAFLGLMADGAQIEAAGLPGDAGEYAREIARLVGQAAVGSSG